MTRAVVKELRIIGTRCSTFREFRRAIEMLRSGTVKPLITTVLHGIESGLKALRKALSREEMKVVAKNVKHVEPGKPYLLR